MKRFTKVCLIVCGISVVLGLLLVGVGTVFGAKPQQYLNMAHIGPDETEDLEDYEYSSTFSKDIQELDLSVNYGQVQILTYEGDQICVLAENVGKHFQCWEETGELHIEDERQVNAEELKLTIYLPKMEFLELDVELGAGYLEADELYAKEFSLEIGAGEGIIGYLAVSGLADMEVGAGRLQTDLFEGSYLEGSCGAGELCVNLAGVLEDYNYELDAAMGEICLGENSYGGLANHKRIQNGASKTIELDCALGSIEISFEEM